LNFVDAQRFDLSMPHREGFSPTLSAGAPLGVNASKMNAALPQKQQ
jgi:hypothetical protein